MNTENNVIVLDDEGGLQELTGAEVLTAWRMAKLDYKPAYSYVGRQRTKEEEFVFI